MTYSFLVLLSPMGTDGKIGVALLDDLVLYLRAKCEGKALSASDLVHLVHLVRNHSLHGTFLSDHDDNAKSTKRNQYALSNSSWCCGVRGRLLVHS